VSKNAGPVCAPRTRVGEDIADGRSSPSNTAQHGFEDTFAKWQPRYAAHGIATFPVKIQDGNKVPAVFGWQKVGFRVSTELAVKFATATTFGFQCGRRNGVTVVDMDSTDESIVTEGERLFGRSPILWRTGGNKFAMAFRYNGESRRIRAFGDDGPPIDLLGGGFAVAPPSAGVKQSYTFLRGSVADFERLPVARIPKEIAAKIAANDHGDAAASRPGQERIREGRRNAELFRYCTSTVVYCDTLDQLIDAARTWAEDRLATPLPAAEIIKTCNSVWQFRGGRRRIMSQILDNRVWHELSVNPEFLGVFAYLDAENGPNAEFMFADGLGKARNWRRRLIPEARQKFLELGLIERIGRRGKTGPHLYRWGTNYQLFDIPLAVGNPSSLSPPPPSAPEEVEEGFAVSAEAISADTPRVSEQPHPSDYSTQRSPSRRKASR
jgi:hypothetical protein